MTQQTNNEAFEKWFDDYEHDNDIRLAIEYGAYGIACDSWQAALTHAEQQRQEQEKDGDFKDLVMYGQSFMRDGKHVPLNDVIETSQASEIAELMRDYKAQSDFDKEMIKLDTNTITELQSHINELRETLEKIAGYDLPDEAAIVEAAKQALASTPSQSLARHDDEVIERCAKVCENMDGDGYSTIEQLDCAQEIRALKSTS